MVKYDGKKITPPSGVQTYKLTASQSLLKWTEVFSLERKKAKKQNILGMYMKIPEKPDLDALEKAYNKLIEVNDALRLVIFKKGGKSYQFIRDYEYEHLEILDLGKKESDFKAFIRETDDVIIPWENHQLTWAKIVKCGKAAALVVRMHHAVADGFSLSLIFRQLNEYYDAFSKGMELPETKTYSIVNYFEKEEKYASSPMHAADRKFWHDAFNHQRKYSFPAGYRSEFGDCSSINDMISGETYEKLTAFCTESGCSLQSVALAAMVLTVYALTEKENFCIYSMTHGRNTPMLKNTVGCMMNTVPVFFDINKEEREKTLKDFIGGTYMNYLQHLSHGNLSMGELTPMTYKEPFRHGLNFNHGWMVFSSLELADAANIDDKEFSFVNFTYLAHQFYGAVMEVKGVGVDLGITYQIRKFKEDRVRLMLDKFKDIFAKAMEDPDRTVEELISECK